MKKAFALFVVAFAMTSSILFASGAKESPEYKKPSVVRLNIASEIDSLDPWQSAAADTASVFYNVFEGLMGFNSKGEFYPQIAKSYTLSDDQKTYTFDLRENVYFHNGKHLTSEDVLYSYETLMGKDNTEFKGRFPLIESVRAVDEYTFEIKLTDPSPAFIASTYVAILPKGYTEQSTNPIGTGPYKFVEYVPGQKVILEKNDNYYFEDRMPQIDRAEIYIIKEEATVVSALQSNQLDVASISANNAKLLESDFKVASSPMNLIQLFGFNNDVKPLDDVRVRQAIAYAINKEDVVNGVFNGYGTILNTNFSPVMAHYYNSDLDGYYTQNIEKAKELLKEAGLEDGFDLTITVPGNYWQHVDTAQIFAQQLAKVNIRVKINSVEWGTWLDEVYVKRNYQSTIIGFDGKLDPNPILARYKSDYARNFMNFKDSDFDKIIDEAAIELDDAKRVDLYKQAQRILTEKAPAAYVCDPNLTVAMRKDLFGYTFYPVMFIDIASMYYQESK